MKNLEIEKKFIIKYPNISKLETMKDVCKWVITQNYLVNDNSGFGRRIRKIEVDEKEEYFFTQKKKITNVTRIEEEQKISKSQYEAYKKEIDCTLNTINKVRYRVKCNDFIYEIDIYEFYKKIAVMEVELEHEDQEFNIPNFVEIIQDVTDDNRFSNYSLAKFVPEENAFVVDNN